MDGKIISVSVRENLSWVRRMKDIPFVLPLKGVIVEGIKEKGGGVVPRGHALKGSQGQLINSRLHRGAASRNNHYVRDKFFLR